MKNNETITPQPSFTEATDSKSSIGSLTIINQQEEPRKECAGGGNCAACPLAEEKSKGGMHLDG